MISLELKSRDDLDGLLLSAREAIEKYGHVNVDILWHGEPRKKRTLTQNASLHLYCTSIAGKMNDAGFTQRQLVGKFKEGFELPVTMEMIKAIFREVGDAMFKKESTSKLTTIEIQEVYKTIDARFGEITGCRAEWPSIESQMDEARK